MTTIIIAAFLLILLAATMVLLQREKKNSSLAWQAVHALEDQLERTKSISRAGFEEAKAAVKAVNDFNVGLSAIMGYDPMQAIRKGRDTEGESE